MILEQRSIVLFQNAINSEKTQDLYMYNLKVFLKYYLLKDYDSLLTIDSKKIQEMIEDYVMYLRQSKSRSTINNVVCSLELFFSMNDIILNFKKIHKFFPEQKKIRGDKPYTTNQLQDILKCCSKHLGLTAIVHFMASSGVRVGFVEELKIKHVGEFEKQGCKAPR